MKHLLLLGALFFVGSCDLAEHPENSVREMESEIDRMLKAQVPDALLQIGTIEGYEGYSTRYDIKLGTADNSISASILEQIYVNGNTIKRITIAMYSSPTGEALPNNPTIGKATAIGKFVTVPREQFLSTVNVTLDQPLGTPFAQANSYPLIREEELTQVRIFNSSDSTWNDGTGEIVFYLEIPDNDEFLLRKLNLVPQSQALLVLNEQAIYKQLK